MIALCDEGTLRLAQGPKPSVGRVEVCVNRTWGTICSQYVDNTDASVICKSLGYSPYGKYIHLHVHAFVSMQSPIIMSV